jgi:hypothetical protein
MVPIQEGAPADEVLQAAPVTVLHDLQVHNGIGGWVQS